MGHTYLQITSFKVTKLIIYRYRITLKTIKILYCNYQILLNLILPYLSTQNQTVPENRTVTASVFGKDRKGCIMNFLDYVGEHWI